MNDHEFFEVLGYLANSNRQCKLDAEMPLKSQAEFETRYISLTEITPYPDDRNYYILHEEADKWGIELRIYFKADINNVPQIIRDMVRSSRPGEPRNCRINDNELIWQLIAHGFLLGDSQDIERIRSRVPPEFMADFERGFSS